jgi:hypothetical protein
MQVWLLVSARIFISVVQYNDLEDDDTDSDKLNSPDANYKLGKSKEDKIKQQISTHKIQKRNILCNNNNNKNNNNWGSRIAQSV